MVGVGYTFDLNSLLWRELGWMSGTRGESEGKGRGNLAPMVSSKSRHLEMLYSVHVYSSDWNSQLCVVTMCVCVHQYEWNAWSVPSRACLRRSSATGQSPLPLCQSHNADDSLRRQPLEIPHVPPDVLQGREARPSQRRGHRPVGESP